jgi:formylglycine-generating enzyme required for sulfatase activity
MDQQASIRGNDSRGGPNPHAEPAPVLPPRSAASSLEAGQVIGECEILKELGRGGMGVVYLGRHIRVEDLRAVKVLPRGMDTDQAIKRFWREGQKPASVNHGNVVRIHDVGRTGDWHYIVMEYIEGRTLEQLIRERGPLLWPDALGLLQPLLDALAAIHRAELIHRDIKPSNIMVTGALDGSVANRLVLMDFGLVHDSQDDGFTEFGTVLGTPAYMASEQARGGKVDHRADIYAVGATLYYLLSGESPFQGSKMSVFLQVAKGDPPPDLSVLRPGIPEPVLAIVRKAMHPSADSRYDSAEEMLNAVRRLLSVCEVRPAVERPSVAPAAEAVAPAPPTCDQAEITERMRQAREKLTAAEARNRPRWTSGQPLAAAAAAVVLGAAVLVLSLWPWPNGPKGGNLPAPTVSPQTPPGMVYIPAGIVHLGASRDRLRAHALTLDGVKDRPHLVQQFVECCVREKLHIMHVPGYWIDRYEVTNAEYQQFVQATNHRAPPNWIDRRPPPGLEQHPVVQVSYADAAAYAAWAKKQLPTIAQWTRAYRGDDDRMYPWGDRWFPGRANDVTNLAFDSGTNAATATPQDVSVFGVYNLVGNVDELMREQAVEDGRTYMIAKGGHSMCRAAIYGVAPFQYLYPVDDVSNEHTGFRCVIEANPP